MSALKYILPTAGLLAVSFASVAKYTALTAAGIPPLDAVFDIAALGAETIFDSVTTIGEAGLDYINPAEVA